MGADAVGVIHSGTKLWALRGQDDLEHTVDSEVRVLMFRISTYERMEELVGETVCSSQKPP